MNPPPSRAARPPINNVFCVRPMRGETGDDAAFLAVRHALREAFGPLVNVMSLPARATGGLNRAGLTTRTVYEFNLFGHGVVLCGGSPLDHEAWLDLEPDALAGLEVPLLVAGLPRGFAPHELRALSDQTDTLLALDAGALDAMTRAGVPAALSGHPALFVERAIRRADPAHAPTPTPVLVCVREPRRTTLSGDLRRALPGRLRDLLRDLAARHGDVRLLCQSDGDRHLAASVSDVDYVSCEDVHDWHDQLDASDLTITFRVEAALASASLGVPFVHLSAGGDDRAALEAAGLGAWSIEIESCSDLGAAVAARVDDLPRLAERRLAAMDTWATLDRALSEAVRSFAARVSSARANDAQRPLADHAAVRQHLGAEPTSVQPALGDDAEE